MKRILFWTTLLGLVSTMPLFGQVGIGTTQPNPSAELEISSANRGLLIPRLSSEDREAIEDPVDGLTVYDKTAKAYSYYDGSRWLFMYNSGSQPEETVTIPGMEMSLPTNLISLVHGNWVEDTAGIIYDSGGNEYHYANNENFEFYLYAGDAVGYKLHIEYDIAAQDSLIFRDLFTENVFSVITNGSGVANIYHFDPGVIVNFKSNGNTTAPGFALYYYKVYEVEPQGIPPSVTGPWYHRPDDFSTAGGFHIIPNEEREMGANSFSYGRGVDASGEYSVAFGKNNSAEGPGTFAHGLYATAKGGHSAAIGHTVSVNGTGSLGIGQFNTLEASYSMVMGRNSKAINSYNFAGGLFAQATGFYSFAYGDSPRATGTYTYAFGWQPFASGTGSMAHGWQNRATGDWAVSWGRQTVSKPYLSFVIGQFNDTTSASSTSWVNTDPLFIAGNGTANNNRSNALTLYKNGNMTIAGTLTQNSDARLKRNIQPIGDALEKLRQLNGYHYQWNTPYADDHEIKSGLLAQEIEKVMPELVRSDGNGVMSVDYSGLIPYLLEAIKTLEEEVEQLKNP